MKKFVMGAVFAVICGSALLAQNFKDGFFFVQDRNFTNNQKNQVVLNVINGKIVAATWNIVTLNVGPDHKAIAAAGTDAAIATWAKQAKALEDYLVNTQDTNPKSVPGGPPNIKPFFDLVKSATRATATPVAKGNFHDGWLYAEEEGTDHYATKNTALIVVVNGTIVDAIWNGIHNGGSKVLESLSNRGTGYNMPGSRRAWHLQSVDVANELIKKQNPNALTMKPDNKPDSISGVSIEISHFLEAVRAALK